VTLSSDENELEFWDYAHWVLDPSQSVGDPLTDMITNVNPAYIGVLYNAGGELQFTVITSQLREISALMIIRVSGCICGTNDRCVLRFLHRFVLG
jgi:hypothetical protein